MRTTLAIGSMSARQRVLSGRRMNWRIGQLIAFVHGPGRKNIYRFRAVEIREGRPYRSRLVTANDKVRQSL